MLGIRGMAKLDGITHSKELEDRFGSIKKTRPDNTS